MILTDEELKRIDNGNYYGDLVILRDVEKAVLAKLCAGVEMPEPALYAHELIANNGGIWLGVPEKGICEKSHVIGETSEEVREYFTADQLRTAIAAARVRALEDAAEEAYLYLGGGSASTAIRALKGTP